jgi:hypothetical protein
MKYLLLTLLTMITIGNLLAQELSPRAYWPAPKGTQVAVLGYAYSWGDVLTDPSLPISGLDSRIHIGFAAYLQTLNLFGRTTNFLIEIPYINGNSKGFLAGEARTRNISGIADIGLTLSANLIGAPSMTPKEFQELRANPHSILGTSVKVLIPTGAYESDKLINVGANRWAIKPELGFMIPLQNRWLLELEAGVWFFADNDEFLGVTRKQEPVFATEIHLVRRFKPGFWGALDLNFFTGGETTVGSEHRADLQRNSRIGVTFAYPFAGRQALKFGFSMGMLTKTGGDFYSVLLTYNVLLN